MHRAYLAFRWWFIEDLYLLSLFHNNLLVALAHHLMYIYDT
jgi:hypothetical protein